MNANTRLKVSYNDILLFGILVFLTTFLRLTLLIVAPVLVIIIVVSFGFTFRKYVLALFGVIFVSYLISFTNGFYLKYNLLSFYYILPFLLFLFSKPKYRLPATDLFASCMSTLAALAMVNNVVGFAQYIHFPNDDSFSGLYAHFTVTQNGLAIVNGVLFYYYFRKAQVIKKLVPLFLCVFFGISFIMGFYGGGILVLVGAMALQIDFSNSKKVVKKILAAILATISIGLIIYWIRPDTLRYNMNIINIFAGKSEHHTPRKLLSYYNYATAYTSNLKDFVFGSGPGTFNSRSAFVVGSPDYFKMPAAFKSPDKPYYFEHYAYTLWNSGNTVHFEDGFMNQPFSSLLAFLGEYGALFTILFAIYYYRQHKTVSSYRVFSQTDRIASDTYKFSSVLLALLLVVDNYAEYPEITILMLLIIKLAELELIKSNTLKHFENA